MQQFGFINLIGKIDHDVKLNYTQFKTLQLKSFWCQKNKIKAFFFVHSKQAVVKQSK